MSSVHIRKAALGAAFCAAAQIASAQPMTTAAEIRPILEMSRPNWVALSTNGGQDFVMFTALLAWRCGLSEIRYGVNGDPAETVLEMEPCHMETAAPNALRMDTGIWPYVAFPPGSVDAVTVEIDYDDGTTDSASWERAQILLP
jgi:hypothetical protein